MITRFEVLRHGETLGRAADLLLTTNQQDFPVMHGEEVIGLLSRRKLIEGLAAKGRDEYLAAYMERDFPRLGPWDDLGEAFQQILAGGGKPLLVFDGARLVGYITHENLMEFMMVERTGK
jgi:predicted transcriptional regulator